MAGATRRTIVLALAQLVHFAWADGFEWMRLHITSFDWPLLGFRKSRSKGKDEKLRQEKAKNVNTPTPSVGVILGHFFFTIKLRKIEILTFF